MNLIHFAKRISLLEFVYFNFILKVFQFSFSFYFVFASTLQFLKNENQVCIFELFFPNYQLNFTTSIF